jgi:dissimilatory sulfite reductase (desulfoviridin) alpha/beta subunit
MAILMLIFFFTSQDPDQGAPPSDREATERRSTNVVMVERSPGSGRTLQIRAGEVVETDDQVIFVIEKIVDWVYRRAWSGRLLSEQLDDINFDRFREEIIKKVPEAKPVVDASGRSEAGG